MPAGTYRNVTGNTALAYGLVARRAPRGLRWCSAATRSPRRPTSCTCSRAQALRRDDHAGRGRDRRRRHRLGASFGGALGVTTPRARPGPQGRDDRPGRLARAPARHRRRPARRPVDRPADQDRAGRPAPGDVWPQRRVAGARRRPRPRPTASTPRSRRAGSPRHTGRPSCCCPTATSPTAPSRGGARNRRPARPHVDFATEPNGVDAKGARSSTPTCATRRRWPGRGRSPARRAGAPHRRHREGRYHRRHLLRPRQPRADDRSCAAQDRRHRRHRSRRWSSTTPTATPRAVLGWGSTYGPITPPGARVRSPATRGRHGPPAPPQPVPEQHRVRCCAATNGSSCPR
jgi:hypothetical protein